MEVLQTKWALLGQLPADSGWSGDETIYITGMHWNDEQILRDAWIPALVDLANAIGRDRVFVSIYESGSWDDTKGALRLLDSLLAQTDIPRRIVMDHKTHLAEINQPPEQEGDGWIETRTGGIELRRVPYLAKLRNEALRPLYELRDKGIVYDKILFLNDVVFSVSSWFSVIFVLTDPVDG